MKKIYFVVAALSLLALTSCSDDEKKLPEPASSNVQQLLLGKWSAVYFAYDQNHNKQLEEPEKEYVTRPHDEVIIEFKANGTCTGTSYADAATVATIRPLTYKVTGNGKKIILNYNTMSDTFNMLSIGDKDFAIFNHIKEDTVQTGQWINYKKIN